MIKKQRVTKALSILSVSLGIVIVTLFSNIQNINAKTYYTSQYSITSAFENFEANTSNGCLTIHVTINFNDYYTGTMRIGLTNTYSADYNLLIYNAKLNGKSSSYFTLVFEKTKNIDVYIVLKASEFYGSIGTTASAVANYFIGNWSSIFDINTVNNVSISVDDPEQDIIDGITEIDSDIDASNGLLQLLVNAQNSTNGQLATIISMLGDISSSGSSSEATFTERPWQVPAYYCFYPFGYLINGTFGWGIQFTDEDGICERFAWLDSNSTYYLCYMSNGYVDGLQSVYYDNHSATVTRMSTPIPLTGTNGFNLFTYKIDTTDGGNFTFQFHTILKNKTIYPIYIGKADSTLPEDLAFYLGIQKENAYTSQLDTITTWLNTIAEEISNIDIQDNTEINNVVNNKNSIITNITNEHNTVNNITNDFTLDFNSANNSITFDSDIISSLTDTATFWNGKMSEVEVSLGDLHYPIVLGFILLALLAFIGG